MIDEALATGDRKFQIRSEERIRELRKEAGTVFLVSHSNKSIRDTCDRVLWLEKGELLMDGPTDEVIKAYEKETGQVGPARGMPRGRAPAGVLRRGPRRRSHRPVREARIPVERWSARRQASVKSVFLGMLAPDRMVLVMRAAPRRGPRRCTT